MSKCQIDRNTDLLPLLRTTPLEVPEGLNQPKISRADDHAAAWAQGCPVGGGGGAVVTYVREALEGAGRKGE